MKRPVKILYLSCNEWGNLGRRKIRLAHELAKQPGVASLLYVNPPVATSLLDWLRGDFEASHLNADRRRHAAALTGEVRQIDDRLWSFTGSTKVVPLTRNERLRRSPLLLKANHQLYVAGLRRALDRLPGDELVVWLNHPLQLPVAQSFSARSLTCYDWTDDWTQFSQLPVNDVAELERANDAAVRAADLVFAVSQSLYTRARRINERTVLAPNATDYAVIARSHEASLAEPADLSAIPSPRLGYIGQIGENIDYDFVRQAALARPDWSWVFVGTVWATRQDEVAALAALPNVHFLGGRPHAQLPAYLRGFDLCVLPHLRNGLTESMDPTKLYDYLASGKPIVSTSVAGTERFVDVVQLADDPGGFVDAIAHALLDNDSAAAARLAYARRNDWSQRASEMWTVMQRALDHVETVDAVTTQGAYS